MKDKCGIYYVLRHTFSNLSEGDWAHCSVIRARLPHKRDYGFPGSKLRSRLSMTSWMLLSCLFLFVVRMLRSLRDSLPLAVIFMCLLALSQRSTDVWVWPGESWIHWIMGCGAAGTCAGGRKSEYSGPWCFQSCSMDARLGL